MPNLFEMKNGSSIVGSCGNSAWKYARGGWKRGKLAFFFFRPSSPPLMDQRIRISLSLSFPSLPLPPTCLQTPSLVRLFSHTCIFLLQINSYQGQTSLLRPQPPVLHTSGKINDTRILRTRSRSTHAMATSRLLASALGLLTLVTQVRTLPQTHPACSCHMC